MSLPPGPSAPRAALALALGLLLACCAPSAPASPAPGPASATLAEALAPDAVWPEVAAALESLRSRPEADVLLTLGEENTRCSLVAEMDARLLRCGEATLRAPTLAEMLRSINAGAMHRAYALEGLSRVEAAREALGSPQPTSELLPPNGIRWKQEVGELAIDFRVEERGQIEATYRGLDGPESFAAASPREAWRLTQERSAALELGQQQRRLASVFEKNLGVLLRSLSLETSTFEGIKLGEGYKGQALFKNLPEKAEFFPISKVFTGDSSRWRVHSGILPPPALLASSLLAETLQDRVIAVEHLAFFTESTFADRAKIRELPCDRLRGWVEQRTGAKNSARPGPRPDEPSPLLCKWRLERGEWVFEIAASLVGISARVEVARSGKEELMARAKEIYQARLRKASCHLCRHVRVGNRHRHGVRVISVDGKACTMTLQNEDATDPLSSMPFEEPCNPSREGDRI